MTVQPDTTGRNCFKKKGDRDNRFRYFSKENEGLGKAGITVLKEPKGHFLPLDSDNLVEKSL
jgi:hypothetical protein